MADRRTKSSKTKTSSSKRTASRSMAKPAMSESYTMQQTMSPKTTQEMTTSSKKKTMIGLAVVIIIALLYYFRGVFVVAIVNGQPISHLELVQELEKQGGHQTLKSLIDKDLIYQEAGKHNITVSQKEVDAETNKLAASLSSQGQNLDQLLAARGMTKNELVDQIKTKILIQKLLAKQLVVSDKEIADYIAANKDSLPQGKSDSDMKAYVKDLLEQKKLTDQAQPWLDNLEKTAKITYFVNL